MKRKYLLLLTVCCSCLLAAFICSGCNNRDSSQKHTDVKNHTSAKETVKPYADFKYTDYFNRSNLSLTDRSMDSIDIDTFKSTFNEFHTALDSDGNEERILSLYDQLCEQLNMLLTDATLAQYAYYLDTESQEKRNVIIAKNLPILIVLKKLPVCFSVLYLPNTAMSFVLTLEKIKPPG